MPEYAHPSDLFIDGQWISGSESRRFPVLDPSDGSLVATFAAATEADCVRAVDAASAALPGWAETPARERGELLRRTYEILAAEAEQLAEVMVRENGKSWNDAIAEARYSAEFFRWFAEEAVRIGGEYRSSPAGDKRILVTRAPIGVSLLITPWNFPAAMAARKLAPALAAGCTTVLKPASETPLTAAYIVEALRRAGLPRGVVNLITPKPVGAAIAALLSDPRVRKLSFTGSTEVGQGLLRQAAEHVVHSAMELGGNAPLLVLPDADVSLAVEGTIEAKMRNGGAACTAANRLYVHESIHDEFVEMLVARLSEFQMGPGLDRDNTLGALVSEREASKVAELVTTAQREGATLRLGGEAHQEGCFYPPTVLTDVQHGSTINATEIFGPVAAIVRYTDVNDAIRMANDSDYGLAAYVFGSETQATWVATQIDSGMVGANRGVISDPAAPFGGVKHSGIGREGSSEGILEYLETKYIALPPLKV